MLDVLVGYDPNDPITAVSVGRLPTSYTDSLRTDALRGARIGVIRARRDTSTAPRARSDSANASSGARLSADSAAALDSARQYRAREFGKALPVIERALADLRAQGAVLVDSLVIPSPPGRRIGNDFETERATDEYLAQHPNAPVKTLKEILLVGGVNPWRARGLITYVGKTPDDPDFATLMLQREAQRVAVLKLMADHQLDAIVYATYDAAPTPIAQDVLTNPRPRDDYGLGDNRGLSPTLGFPALTVPAGFTSDLLPIGLEFLGRPFSEPSLLGYAFAYEQATRHRRPPATTPRLAPPGR
jgi:Asp-tRNA(Asn)/Glu-tRNA(Gln) amidotransferase A subunit family amidase